MITYAIIHVVGYKRLIFGSKLSMLRLTVLHDGKISIKVNIE